MRSIQQAGLTGFNLLNNHTLLYLADGSKEPVKDERPTESKHVFLPFLLSFFLLLLPNYKFC
jgi:hypothetical protein